MSQKMEWARQERGGEKIETGCNPQGSLFCFTGSRFVYNKANFIVAEVCFF